uniref:hypothetical protein n=1 Tax=Streptococcus agalactiae TaxID=1311 RepID=UPI0003726193
NVDIGCPFVFVSFKTDYNTQSSVYFYSIHPLSVYTKDNGMGYQEELCMHKRLKWLVAAMCL